MAELSTTELLTAGEAYIQTTANKWANARKKLEPVIIRINKAIKNGKFSIELEKGKIGDVEIEFLENHGYKYIRSNIGWADTIDWDVIESKK